MSQGDIQKLDKNFVIESKLNIPDLRFYNVKEKPFKIYGLYNPLGESQFKRMPDDVALSVDNECVRGLYRNTAGGRVRFATNSPYIAIKAVMSGMCRVSHGTFMGTSGFDIFIDSPDGSESIYMKSFIPPLDMKDGYESKLDVIGVGEGVHYFTINFPLYANVHELYVGIADGSELSCGAPYRDFAPVVYYGSSITQGGCASRPGNAYQAMVARDLNIDFINLGFSGGAKGEEEIAKYITTLKMSAFVCDYDHNAPTEEHFERTHRRFYEIFRSVHPDVPYIMMSRPDYHGASKDFGRENVSSVRKKIILDTYNYAHEKGDTNLYFIDGEGIFRGRWEDCCTVDGIHPNDLGFAHIADAVSAVLKRIIRNGRMGK